MKLVRNIYIASKIFKTHRTRTLLSVLGIVIGIASVIAIINAGQSLKQFILAQIEVFGTDYIEIEVKVPSTKQASRGNVSGLAQGIQITTLKTADAKKIRQLPNVKQVYSGVLGQEIVSRQGVNKVSTLWGVSAGFFEIDKGKVKDGRAFTSQENESLAQVAILGAKIKQDLFGEQNAIGKKINIGQRKFKVIGVRENIGAGTFIDFDNIIILPVKTLQKKIMGINYISFIMASIADMSQVDQTVNNITQIMRRQHNITNPDKDDFGVTSSTEAMQMMDTIFNALTILLVAIAAISLIVGGVGVMNIMYVSVLERTYEIGLRKAVGAKNSDILAQFLSEAMLITALGGAIGVTVGIVSSLLITTFANNYGFNVNFTVSISGIIISVLFMMFTGIMFGLYPARKAAGLDPVTALRYE